MQIPIRYLVVHGPCRRDNVSCTRSPRRVWRQIFREWTFAQDSYQQTIRDLVCCSKMQKLIAFFGQERMLSIVNLEWFWWWSMISFFIERIEFNSMKLSSMNQKCDSWNRPEFWSLLNASIVKKCGKMFGVRYLVSWFRLIAKYGGWVPAPINAHVQQGFCRATWLLWRRSRIKRLGSWLPFQNGI